MNLVRSNCAPPLTWSFSENRAALCNDFTLAGFFHRNSTGENDTWVIYLEGGALCYSPETCNSRYFQPYLRERYSSDDSGNVFDTFDTELAWSETGAAGRSLREVVNPLMTSTYCFGNETGLLSGDKSLSIEGRDMLSRNCTENPTFCKHGHVLVPYCSSDVWLGSENVTTRQYSSRLEEEPCNCFDQDCFQYNPTSDDLQFTFRGQTIFRSVLQTLDTMYDLQSASEIVLVGSSAGGVGVVNSAKWVREAFENVSIKVIADSSWFINFRDTINQEFGAVTQDNSGSLLDLLSSVDACNDTRFGYPCCLSANCLLIHNSTKTGESYYPHDVPLFTLTSLYDGFLLALTLLELVPEEDEGIISTGLAIDFTIAIAEYGGAMNTTVIGTDDAASLSNRQLSFYVTGCFQHIYFHTSNLCEIDVVFCSQEIEFSSDVITFR